MHLFRQTFSLLFILLLIPYKLWCGNIFSDVKILFPSKFMFRDDYKQAVCLLTSKAKCILQDSSLDLRLPHSVSRNEHVQIKAVVHNYRNSKLEVRFTPSSNNRHTSSLTSLWPEPTVCLQVLVILDKTEDMCSVAFSGPHRQQVSVQASSSKLITYTIIPLKTGELPLQVTAIATSFMGEDAVRKNLRVVVSY